MKRLFVVMVSCAALAWLDANLPSSQAADKGDPTDSATKADSGQKVKADKRADRQAARKADKKTERVKADKAAVERARKTVHMLDEIYKKTIVMITDKYVKTTDDFAAGSAAVLLFDQISEGGTHDVRLIDATGSPYDPENVAKDAFEEEAIQRLKAGAASHEEIVTKEGQPTLRVVTAVPVVMERCIMCHDHYADAEKGEPIGAISYSIAIE